MALEPPRQSIQIATIQPGHGDEAATIAAQYGKAPVTALDMEIRK
jgi:hypothetical protein